MIAVPAPALLPAAAAARAAATPGAFWLSTPAADGAGVGRDLVGAAPTRVVRGSGVQDLGSLERAWTQERAAWTTSGSLPPAAVPAGVGWFGYELGRRFCGLPPDARAVGPLYELRFHDAVWAREAGGEATIFARDVASAGRLADLLGRPRAPVPPRLGRLSPEHPASVFEGGVRRILDYLGAGDAYQVNLSRRLAAEAPLGSGPGDPIALAAALRRFAPAPHAAYLGDLEGGGAVIGNSPERFLAVDPAGRVETCPIKGTRPRGASADADRAAAAELAASDKDRAEHVMIVDLERNDLGRVCRTGTVEVARLARMLSLPTVHHLVSSVRGVLRPGVGLGALLAATFPGGSVTGAPKRRAMQIIDELEPGPRGVYTGATGWLGAAGDLDLAIAIRTAVFRHGRLAVSVGGGVVADSTPAGELGETETKARAFAALCDDGQDRVPP